MPSVPRLRRRLRAASRAAHLLATAAALALLPACASAQSHLQVGFLDNAYATGHPAQYWSDAVALNVGFARWDVNWRDLLPSALHGLHEFLSIVPALKPGTLMLVDDTPKDASVMARIQPRQLKEFNDFVQTYGFAPGKGALIKDYLVRHGLGREIAHDYQLLWQF